MAHAERTPSGADDHAATPDEGGDVRGPDGLCVREAVLRSLREDVREVDFVCSNDTLDSYGERVAANWDLKRFQRNPVALFAHQSRELPIGSWKNVRVEKGELVGTLKIGSKESNPLCENILQCIREGSLRAVSVGFIPHSYRWEKENDVEILWLDDNELMEISVVPIPANPDALAKMKARALAEQREKQRPAPKHSLGDAAAHPAPARPNPPAPSSASKEPTMAIENETKSTSTISEKDVADLRAKAAEAEARAVKAEADRDAKVKAAEDAKKLADEGRAAAEKQLVETKEKLLALQVESDLAPLLGTKLAPAEKDGNVEIGKLFLAQGDAGAAKWKAHLAGIGGRADIPQKAGGSVLPTEPDPAGAVRGAASADAGDELTALVNQGARELTT